MRQHRSKRLVVSTVALAVLLAATACVWTVGSAHKAVATTDLLASNWTPAKGATGVALFTNISVKFNQEVAAETITSGTFYLTKQGDSWPLEAVTVSYNASTRVATIDPTDELLPATPYVVTLTNDIESATGQRLTNWGDWTFTTDTAGQVLSRYPSPGSTNTPTSANVTVTFDKALDVSTVSTSSFRLESATGTLVTAPVSLSSDNRTVTLNPVLDLVGGMTYIVRVESTVRTATGLPVAGTPLTWSFSTVLAPRVIATVPADGAINQPVNQSITVVFDQDVDQATLTSGSFFVGKPGGTPLAATITYNPAGRTATLTPQASFQPGMRYQVTLTQAVRGVNGASLAGAPVTWIFTVLADAPTIVSRVPDDGATTVSITQSIQVVFGTEMNPATISSAGVYVQPLGGSPVSAAVTYDAALKTATVDPLVPLEEGTLYQVTVSAAVLGESGMPLVDAPAIWFFTTETAANSFADVIPGVTPYAAAIIELSDRGIITGFLDGTFRPYEPLSRQQFAKMIVLSLGLPVTGLEICPFTDVVPQTGGDPLYPLRYVAVCAFRGIAQGKTATSFAPYESITRQQLVTMIARAAKLAVPPAWYVAPFTSSRFSTSEHYQNARKAAFAGLLDGLTGVATGFDFRLPSSRGECAQLLSSLIDYRD